MVALLPPSRLTILFLMEVAVSSLAYIFINSQLFFPCLATIHMSTPSHQAHEHPNRGIPGFGHWHSALQRDLFIGFPSYFLSQALAVSVRPQRRI